MTKYLIRDKPVTETKGLADSTAQGFEAQENGTTSAWNEMSAQFVCALFVILCTYGLVFLSESLEQLAKFGAIACLGALAWASFARLMRNWHRDA